MKTLTEYLKFHTKTHRAYVHITPQVEQIVGKSGVREGMVLVSAMHITAGVYVNDNESGLIEDIACVAKADRETGIHRRRPGRCATAAVPPLRLRPVDVPGAPEPAPIAAPQKTRAAKLYS